jgi:putative phosphoesterase
MRIGVVSDIHCNAAALEKALGLLHPYDELFCLGDAIYEFRFSNEVVAILRRENAHVIRGNHEEAFFSPAGARARAAASVDQDHADWLASQPLRKRVELDGIDFHLCHSTPWEPRGAYVIPEDPALARFGDTDAHVVLYGHTHRQVVCEIDGTLVINPGSSGDARDVKNNRRLSCALVETQPLQARIIDFDAP